ncbi:MAG: ferrous iron transporter B [Clostridia bacterium]|nr:ferrous iron transporter B [Clostridia bacterium]
MKKIILVGNPNCGKTTLLNSLCSAHEKASNWHGVTVDVVSKYCELNGEKVLVFDIPGIYSLNGYSNEEKIACEFLNNNKDALILNVVDAGAAERSLKLTLELVENGFNVFVVFNMANEISKNKKFEIEKVFSHESVFVDARKVSDVQKIKKIITKLGNKKVQNNKKLIEKLTNFKINQNLKVTKSEKFDGIFLNKFIFSIIFLIVLFGVFYIVFGNFGDFLTKIFSGFVDLIFGFFESLIIKLNANEVIKSFLINGIFAPIKTIIEFIPQIALLMFLINMLEDTGLMSRIAFMFDGALKKIGLTGKALFSLMMGYGCTVSAVMTTRNLENKNLRHKTLSLIPFTTCSAKLPIFLCLTSVFFNKFKYLFVIGLYLFSIVIGIIFMWLTKGKSTNKNLFIFEIPKYRFPNFKKILTDLFLTIKEFLIKVGSIILVFSVLIWFLQNFSLSFQYIGNSNFSNSILFNLSNFLSHGFKFIGLESAGIVASLIIGLVAKEMIVVSMCLMNGVSGIEALSASLVNSASVCSFTSASALSFLVFVLLYSPCLSALSTIKNEFGTKEALKMFFKQFLIAFLVSGLVFNFYLYINKIWVFFAILIVAIIIIFMIKFLRKKKYLRGCYDCKKVCGNKTFNRFGTSN